MRVAAALVAALAACASAGKAGSGQKHKGLKRGAGVVTEEGTADNFKEYDWSGLTDQLDTFAKKVTATKAGANKDLAKVLKNLNGKSKDEVQITLSALKSAINKEKKTPAKPAKKGAAAPAADRNAEKDLDSKLKKFLKPDKQVSKKSADWGVVEDDSFTGELDAELDKLADLDPDGDAPPDWLAQLNPNADALPKVSGDAPPKRTIPMGSFDAGDFTSVDGPSAANRALQRDLMDDLKADLQERYAAEEKAAKAAREAQKAGTSWTFCFFMLFVGLAGVGMWYNHGCPVPEAAQPYAEVVKPYAEVVQPYVHLTVEAVKPYVHHVQLAVEKVEPCVQQAVDMARPIVSWAQDKMLGELSAVNIPGLMSHLESAGLMSQKDPDAKQSLFSAGGTSKATDMDDCGFTSIPDSCAGNSYGGNINFGNSYGGLASEPASLSPAPPDRGNTSSDVPLDDFGL